MVQIQNVLGPPIVPERALGANPKLSETGQFDFQSYLLGLQTDSTNGPLDTSVDAPNLPVDEAKDNDLLSLFDPTGMLLRSNFGLNATANSLLSTQGQAALDATAFGAGSLGPALGLGLSTNGVADQALTALKGQVDGESASGVNERNVSLFHLSQFLRSSEGDSVGINDEGEVSTGAASELGKPNRGPMPGMDQLRSMASSGYGSRHATGVSEAVTSLKAVGQAGEGETIQRLESAEKKTLGSTETKGNRTQSALNGFSLSELGPLGGHSADTDTGQVKVGSKPAVTVPELVSTVQSMVHHGGGRMTVSLSPPDLGEVEIAVTARGNRLEILVRSDNERTRGVLQEHLGDLKTALQSQDLILSKMEVQVSREPMGYFGESRFADFTGHQPNPQSQSYRQSDQRPGSGFQETVAPSPVRVSSQPSSAVSQELGNGRLNLWV